jgi:hypothetical protein
MWACSLVHRIGAMVRPARHEQTGSSNRFNELNERT